MYLGGGENLGSHEGLISCPGMDESTRPDMKAVSSGPDYCVICTPWVENFIPASSRQYTQAEMNALVEEVPFQAVVCTLGDSQRVK